MYSVSKPGGICILKISSGIALLKTIFSFLSLSSLVPSSGVTLTFTLPSELTHATLPANTMPLTFSASDAAYDDRQAALVDQSNPVASFNPAAGASLSLSIEGQLRIYLGASVAPGAGG